jgi:hypothetical protein
MTTTDAIAYHREETRRLLRGVDDALERDELEMASRMLWRAATESIRSAATLQGWEHDSEVLLPGAIDRLVDEEGFSSDLLSQYMMLYAYGHFPLGDPPSSAKIRYGKKHIAEFIYALENPKPPPLSELAPSPPPDTDDRTAYHRQASRRHLEQVDNDIAIGLGEHARDQLWAAAAHAIKAAAARRSWPGSLVHELGATVDRLTAEEGMPSHLTQLYLLGSAYSREGWQTPMNTARIRYTKDDIARFISEFEAWDQAPCRSTGDSW